MKYFGTILLLAFSLISFAQEKATIGMTKEDVMKIYPKVKADSNENGITLSRHSSLYGLEDDWGYRFKQNKLDWIFFHKYINEINETNFKKCLSVANQLIADFANFYGKPDTTIIGDTTFVDPFVKKHWGYKVIEARWRNYKGMKIKIEFTFFGGKGDYFFLVKVNYFEENYPFYD